MMNQVNAIFMGRQLTFCDLVTVLTFFVTKTRSALILGKICNTVGIIYPKLIF